MKHSFQFFFLLFLLFGCNQILFSQGVVRTDHVTIYEEYNPCITSKVTKYENQSSSALLQVPNCDDKTFRGSIFSIQINSSCPNSNNLGCDKMTIGYDCALNTWLVYYPRECNSPIPTNPDTQNSITLGNSDPSSDVTHWQLSLTSSANGLSLNSFGPCASTITVVKEEFFFFRDKKGCERTVEGSDSRIQSHPNPTTGIVDVQFEGVKEGTANIQVYNNIGTLVQEIPSVSVYQGKNNTEMDLSNLPAGLYNIVIRQGETAATQRIQKL